MLPQGWIKCKFSDIATIRNGYAFSKNDFSREQNHDNGIPLVKQTQLDGNKVDLSKACYLPTNYLKEYSDFLIQKDDVLIGMSGSIGKLCIYQHDFPALQNQRTGLIKTYNNEINNKFFWLFLQTIETKLMSGSKGVGVQNISSNDIEEIDFSLPPLFEQQRIVAKIDSLFSELENGITLLKTIKAQLAVYRQAVLKWAFEGKNFKSVKMSQMSKAFGGGAFKSNDFLLSGKYQVIRIGNVRPGIIRYNERPIFLNKLSKNEGKYLLEKGDVVITLTGTRKKRDYGFTAVIDKDNLVLNQRVAAIRFYRDYSPKFFLYYSWTNKFKDDFFVDETGNVGQGNVGMKAITETFIPYCPHSEQQAIVSAIESRLSVCDKLEQTIDQTLALSASLRQSILKKAFEGRLVPQDPNDEPAEKLLERIHLEKAAVQAKQKQRKAKKWKTSKR
jgi:type I restriction enzyme S subunit